jgi:uncharacterized membrane protein
MNGYNLALFIHLLGVIALFIAIGLVQRGGVNVRTAESVQQARTWLGLLRTTRTMFPSSGVVILLAGLYMAGDAWEFSDPWIVVSIVALVLMLAVGGAVIGRRFQAMGQAAATAPDGPVAGHLKTLIEDPLPWVLVYMNTGIGLGILWLMTNKPDWAASILIVVGLGALGAVLGMVGLRRTSGPSRAVGQQ